MEWIERHDAYQLDGGNALPLDANTTLVAFTGTYQSDDDPFVNSSYVFELETSGRLHGALKIPRPAWKSGSYRVMPFASVGGESGISPWGPGTVAARAAS